MRSLITIDLALEAVEEAMRGLADGSASNLPRRRIALEGSTLHLMASAVRSANAFGLKT